MTYLHFKCRRCGDVLKIKTHERWTLEEHLKQKHPLLWKRLCEAAVKFDSEFGKLENKYKEKNLGSWFELVGEGAGWKQG